MGSLVTYLVYSKCWPDYIICFMKYLGIFEVVIIFKVCSIYNICDSVNLALEIIPSIDIPFCTPKNLFPYRITFILLFFPAEIFPFLGL